MTETTRLEQLVQQLIDLFVDSDTTKETYSVAVATVIKEAREDLLRDVEKCLGRDLDKAIEQLTWLDEFHDEEESGDFINTTPSPYKDLSVAYDDLNDHRSLL